MTVKRTCEQSYQVPIYELRELIFRCYPRDRIDRVVVNLEFDSDGKFVELTKNQVFDFYAGRLERIGRVTLTRIPEDNATRIFCEPSGKANRLDAERSLQRSNLSVPIPMVFADPDAYIDNPNTAKYDMSRPYQPGVHPFGESEHNEKSVSDRLQLIQRERPKFWEIFLKGLCSCLDNDPILRSTVLRRGGRPKGTVDERNREIYRKFCVDGMTLQEIANVTEGIGYESVKQIVREQRRKYGECEEMKKKGR